MSLGLWRTCLENAAWSVPPEPRYPQTEEGRSAKWGVGKALSHVFSFQSFSPRGPEGFPPAQATSGDSSLSKGEVASAEPNKGIKFLTFKFKRLLFPSPSSKLGERKSKIGGHWLPPTSTCIGGGGKGESPAGHKDPVTEGNHTSMRHQQWTGTDQGASRPGESVSISEKTGSKLSSFLCPRGVCGEDKDDAEWRKPF